MVVTRSKARNANTAMKYSPNPKPQGQGKILLPDPVTVPQMMVMMILHVCRKIILFPPDLKVGVYLMALFVGGLIGDFLPPPRTYLARKDNVFNVYFVKMGWAWTLFVAGAFMYFTSFTYCCGNIDKVKKHMSRLAIGTFFWFFWTNAFVFIEEATGFCLSDAEKTKTLCLQHGYKWFGFDISGHCFLLIYSSLILMEEAKVMKGWENISELIRYEAYDEDTSLRFLTPEEVSCLKEYYQKYGPYIRGGFVTMTSLLLIWDVMLIGTILYFHSMVQKVMGGIIAVCTWFFTYRYWYASKSLPTPGLPGHGAFDYQTTKSRYEQRRASLTNYTVRRSNEKSN